MFQLLKTTVKSHFLWMFRHVFKAPRWHELRGAHTRILLAYLLWFLTMPVRDFYTDYAFQLDKNTSLACGWLFILSCFLLMFCSTFLLPACWDRHFHIRWKAFLFKSYMSDNSQKRKVHKTDEESEDDYNFKGVTASLVQKKKSVLASVKQHYNKQYHMWPFLGPSSKGELHVFCRLSIKDFSCSHTGQYDCC